MDELEKANSICVYEAYDGIYMKKSHKDTLLACLEGAPEKAIFRNVKELSEKKINEKELSRKESGENESGEKESANNKMSKRGSPYLRKALFNAALIAAFAPVFKCSEVRISAS